MDHGRHTYLTFRNILIYVVLLWSGMTVNAQSGKGSFAGRVVDKDTKQPVGYAAVRLLTLPDSTFLAGVATTERQEIAFSKGGETMRVKVRSV